MKFILSRLKKISIDEIWVRIKSILILKIEAVEERFKIHNAVPAEFVPLDGGAFLFNRPSLEVSADKEAHKQNKDLLFPVKFFELSLGTYSKSLNWHRHPKTGYEWEKVFYGKIDFSPGKPTGDIKYVWELNRFQHFFHYGVEYVKTKDSAYPAQVVKQIDSWIQDNPYLSGVNWASALEVSLRAISWLFARDQFVLTSEWTHKFDQLFQTTLYNHGHYLNRHLSFYSSPYNHLIGEACGLFLIGSFFQNDSKAQKWSKKGLSILQAEVEKQFHKDGVSVEQSFSYQRFVMEFYLLALIRCRKLNIKVKDGVFRRLEKSVEFLAAMVLPNGHLPKVGDNDDGRVFEFCEKHFWEFDSLFSIAACIFCSPKFKYFSNGFDTACEYLLTREDKSKFENLPSKLSEYHHYRFPYGGYYLWRSGFEETSDFLMIDCGPIAEGLHKDNVPSAAHGHADMLSFLLYHNGEPLFVDSGMLSYNESIEDHQYFRASSAHNTVSVDAQSQALESGRMKWSFANEPECHCFLASKAFSYFCGEYTGFVHTGDRICHQRKILFIHKHLMLIIDEIKGHSHHDYQLNFNMPKKITPELHQNVVKLKKDVLLISVSHTQWDLCRARKAIGYGVEEESRRLTLKQSGESGCRFVNIVHFVENDRELSREFITIGSVCYQIAINEQENIGINIATLEDESFLEKPATDFEISYYNRDLNGKSRMIGINGTRFAITDCLNIKVDRKMKCCDFQSENGVIKVTHPSQEMLNFELDINNKTIENGQIIQEEMLL